MKSPRLPVDSLVRIAKGQLQAIIDKLIELGYRTVGPRVVDEAVAYRDLTRADQLPIGIVDRQDGGYYRLENKRDNAHFDYVVGPHSLKNYLFPPRDVVLESQRVDGRWKMQVPAADATPLAVIGVRSCDLHALEIQDRVFLEGPYVDSGYQKRREQLFLIAVNCRRAAATCFCHSMKTGPGVDRPCDLTLTEFEDSFVIRVGSVRGGDVLAAADWSPCNVEEMERVREQTADLLRRMGARTTTARSAESEPSGPAEIRDAATPPQTADSPPDGVARGRHLDTNGLRELLLDNLEHPQWREVADRCLSCANCTMVCPTCFCSSVEEVADLTGDRVTRERSWASCFTAEHSYMNSGTVRKSTASRYRQWLTHKLATWNDQFGVSGCVGCGRCITWCPVGIDLTEEVAAIRGESS